jgi:acyl-CoA dehydrogenase
VVLARSSTEERRNAGLSQFIVPLPDPRVSITPIVAISGQHHFNQVVFDSVFVPAEQVLGELGRGWTQVISELAYERSGPERFLSTMPLLEELQSLASRAPGDVGVQEDLGSLVSSLVALREMSLDVAHELESGTPPVVAAAVVKDLGTMFEQDSVQLARRAKSLLARGTAAESMSRYSALLADALVQSPNFTLRGGTNEILRGIVARELLGS